MRETTAARDRRRVLVTSTFPIVAPRHGGQKRIRAIVDAYGRRFGSVGYSAVYNPQEYSRASRHDIGFSPDMIRRAAARPLTGDLIAGHGIAEDADVRARFSRMLTDLKPDIIHVEHPFSYLGLRPLLDDLGLAPKIVFGSANIEAPLRDTVLRQFGIPEPVIAESVAEIDEVERRFSAECDLLAACTVEDLDAHRAMGATATVLAPNGMEPLSPGRHATSAWRRRIREAGGENFAAFVGSGHLPNIAGFEALVGRGLGFLQRDQRLVLAGSIGDALEGLIGEPERGIESATFWLRAVNAGRLREASLQGLIAAADILVLPISSGGGSNLKTAEAILADTRVVCSSFALRGFEWFADFPNVTVADTREEFHRGIEAAFRAPLTARTPEQQEKAQTVTWRNCLAPLVEAVAAL